MSLCDEQQLQQLQQALHLCPNILGGSLLLVFGKLNALGIVLESCIHETLVWISTSSCVALASHSVEGLLEASAECS